MKIIDFPVVILAAGLGKRFGGSFNGLNKTLLHIDDEHTILDNILYNIIDVGVTKIIIITGYNSDKIIEYCENLKISYQNKPILNKISKKFLNTKIEVIKARDDYKKGPLYTFLTINRYIFEGSKKIDNILSEEHDFFVVIPADTILNRKILEKILNYQIVIDTKKMKNNKSEV
ncbi:MAG: NTP transferase domain-containing protein, partial [archaeon]|nr:NTP transferase domain-containing protein [archaeon]